MTPGQIQEFLEALIRAGGDAVALAPQMTEEELSKLESQVAEALPVVMNSAPGSYTLDLPHQMALALVGILAGGTLQYNQETGEITAPDVA